MLQSLLAIATEKNSAMMLIPGTHACAVTFHQILNASCMYCVTVVFLNIYDDNFARNV